MTPLDAVLIFILAGVAAATQSLSGFGFSLLIVPPLALVIGPKEAVVVATAMGSLLNVAMLSRLHGSVDWRLWGTLLASAAVGMPLGLLGLVAVDPATLRVIIGVTVIISTVMIWRGLRIHRSGIVGDIAAGLTSGVLNTSTSMSGPPVVLYLQGRGIAADTFRATLTAFFLASGLYALGLFVLGGRIDRDAAANVGVGAPALAIGWYAGHLVYRRLDERRFRSLVVAVLLASATIVLISATVG